MTTLAIILKGRELGRLSAWSHNKEAETGTIGSIDCARREHYRQRVETLANILYGPEIYKHFGQGYDETIDFYSMRTGVKKGPRR